MEAARVGLYLRLSRDDGADSQESMSIGNQRAFLLRYAEECGWSAVEIYIDDGYTGTNFQRPDFQRMIEDIEQKKIDTVLTKDLSRLGRDQIGTLYYLQVYFPSKGVRYIAVSEGIDTSLGGGSITTPFLAAANDFYTADISRKVRAALDIRKQNGLFIGAAAPLGYQKDPESKGHLLPDLQTAWIVRKIFQDYLCHGNPAHQRAVLDVDTLLQKKFFSLQRQQFRVELGGHSGAAGSLFVRVRGEEQLGTVFFRPMLNGQAKQFFHQAVFRLMPQAVAHGQVNGNEAKGSQAAQGIFSL